MLALHQPSTTFTIQLDAKAKAHLFRRDDVVMLNITLTLF